MRLLSAVLFVSLTASSALAEEPNSTDPKPEVTRKKVPYRVVKTLPDSQQVLLFDKIHSTHIVAEVGDPLDDGYTVEEIDDDEVTLLSEDGTPVILAEPPPPRQPRRVVAKAKPKVVAERPADPYAGVPDAIDAEAAAPAATTPVDPYAEAPATDKLAAATDKIATARPTYAPIVVVDEPSDPYGDPGIAAFAEAVGAAPPAAPVAPEPVAAKPKKKASKAAQTENAASLASAITGEPTGAAPLTAAPTPAAVAAANPDGVVILAHGELDSALGDFSKLAATFRATFTTDGVRFDAVHDGTLLAKIGIRKGDVVMTVDGKPLRTLDDAAGLYARSTTMKMATVQVQRGGKLVVLRVAIR